jgi:hypothetical protein
MKKIFYRLVVAVAVVLGVPAVANAQMIVIGGDGAFLGVVNDERYDQNSICNRYGQYGSKYEESIFNPYGTYGGKYSELGTYNSRGQNPPAVVDKQGTILAFITKNNRFNSRIDPDIFRIQVCGEPL